MASFWRKNANGARRIAQLPDTDRHTEIACSASADRLRLLEGVEMTRVTDRDGTRWVEYPPRKRRAPRTGGRFSELEVGQQLVKVHTAHWTRAGVEESSRHTYYAVVTDLWFDPVVGEKVEWRGQMVAIAQIGRDGLLGGKQGVSRHGLACAGWHKTDVDYRAICLARVEAMKSGAVVGIGAGHRIRARPKLPGGSL